MYTIIASVFCLLKKKEEALHYYTKGLDLLKQRINKVENQNNEGKTSEEVEKEKADLQRRLKILEEKVSVFSFSDCIFM